MESKLSIEEYILAQNISSVLEKELESLNLISKDQFMELANIANLITTGNMDSNNSFSCVNEKAYSLQTIFSSLKSASLCETWSCSIIDEKIIMPIQSTNNLVLNLEKESVRQKLTAEVLSLQERNFTCNDLLYLCRKYLSYMPMTKAQNSLNDFSIYDQAVLAAGIASCIDKWFKEASSTETISHHILHKNIFCIFSYDISGIQEFIYSISSKGALKALRARSFYLELLSENLADEILDSCGLTRCNLLYSGGGHAYILLPNTPTTVERAKQCVHQTNQWIINWFDTRLFVACGYHECSGMTIMGQDDNQTLAEVFQQITMKIEKMKLRRYYAVTIQMFNNIQNESYERECTICGASDNLKMYKEDIGTDITYICQMCASFMTISKHLTKPDVVIALCKGEADSEYPKLPVSDGFIYMCVIPKEELYSLKNNNFRIRRLYSRGHDKVEGAISLFWSDFAATHNGEMKTFDQLAINSDGIIRLAGIRMDVDNLGDTFRNGFLPQYATLARSCALSRSLSLFFKLYLPYILANPIRKDTNEQRPRDVVLVYAGGDDLFLVGAWDEVLAASIDIREKFNIYTGGAVSLSCGVGMFGYTYPIIRMAEESAMLESCAKAYERDGKEKNAISLFGQDIVKGKLKDQHTYQWDEFIKEIYYGKLKDIDGLVENCPEIGASFLHNVLYLLRKSENGRIHFARLAYLLARHEPKDEERGQQYRTFSLKMYQWACDAKQRKQMITALLIYLYEQRDSKGEWINDN